MKTLFIILLTLFSFAAKGQKQPDSVDIKFVIENLDSLLKLFTSDIIKSGDTIPSSWATGTLTTIPYMHENADTSKHVHYFKWVDLPQCNMGNGRICATAHYTVSDCLCGAKWIIENVYPGGTVINATYKKKN